METKSTTKVVTMYQANIKFEGKWTLCPETKTLEETLAYVMRARKKTHSRNLPCNIIENVHVVPAE